MQSCECLFHPVRKRNSWKLRLWWWSAGPPLPHRAGGLAAWRFFFFASPTLKPGFGGLFESDGPPTALGCTQLGGGSKGGHQGIVNCPLAIFCRPCKQRRQCCSGPALLAECPWPKGSFAGAGRRIVQDSAAEYQQTDEVIGVQCCGTCPKHEGWDISGQSNGTDGWQLRLRLRSVGVHVFAIHHWPLVWRSCLPFHSCSARPPQPAPECGEGCKAASCFYTNFCFWPFPGMLCIVSAQEPVLHSYVCWPLENLLLKGPVRRRQRWEVPSISVVLSVNLSKTWDPHLTVL